MTYFETPGALLDVGCYMVDFYNEDRIKTLYAVKYRNVQNEIIRNYLELKSLIGELPETLHPFAYYDDHYYSIITAAIYKQPMETLTFEGFLDYLGSDDFILEVYTHWFGKDCSISGVNDIPGLDVLNRISALNLPPAFQYQLMLFFDRFDQYREELIVQFKRIYPVIAEYRKANQQVIESCKIKFDNEFFLSHFAAKFDTDISSFSYSLAFVNSIHYYFNRSNRTLVLGVLYNLQFWSNTDVKTFSYIFHKPEIAKMVEFLSRYPCVSYSQLVEYMGVNKIIVNRYYNDLLGEGVLKTKYKGKEAVLYLNEDYFKNLPGIYNQAFAKLTGAKKDEA